MAIQKYQLSLMVCGGLPPIKGRVTKEHIGASQLT